MTRKFPYSVTKPGIVFLLLAIPLFTSSRSSAQEHSPSSKRPNFIIIVADDMGFSDAGVFGGEIPTPSINQLAHDGVRYTNFYTSMTCSPTRSMLLTGMDNHLVGLGVMDERKAPNQEGKIGYEGRLNSRAATLAEILKANGYHTYITGKWHLGKDPDHFPSRKGFERDYCLLDGGASHFTMDGPKDDVHQDAFRTSDGKYITELPSGYYSSKTFTDKMIEFIEANRRDGKPFLAYVAHQAPHEPLQVPNDWLRRHKFEYDVGWDSLRSERFNRMKALGILDDAATLAPRMWNIPEWDKLTGYVQKRFARKMEIYASMVEYMDMEIGRLLRYIDDIGERENTYVIFFSDNGPEQADYASAVKNRKGITDARFLALNYATDYASWGRWNSYMGYGAPWAQVSATPFWLYKATAFEGGIRSPLIVRAPGNSAPGSINTEGFMHVMDITPTILDIAGIPQPKEFEGRTVLPMQGVSWKSVITHSSTSPRGPDDWVAWEVFSASAVRKGNWKIVRMPEPLGQPEWQLFNLKTDTGEQHDLSKEHPEIFKELLGHWQTYEAENGVVIPNRHPYEQLEKNLPARPTVITNWPVDPDKELEHDQTEVEDD